MTQGRQRASPTAGHRCKGTKVKTKNETLTSCPATIVVSTVNGVQQLVRRPPMIRSQTPLLLLPRLQLRGQCFVREFDNPISQSLARIYAQVCSVLFADDRVVREGAVEDRFHFLPQLDPQFPAQNRNAKINNGLVWYC